MHNQHNQREINKAMAGHKSSLKCFTAAGEAACAYCPW